MSLLRHGSISYSYFCSQLVSAIHNSTIQTPTYTNTLSYQSSKLKLIRIQSTNRLVNTFSCLIVRGGPLKYTRRKLSRFVKIGGFVLGDFRRVFSQSLQFEPLLQLGTKEYVYHNCRLIQFSWIYRIISGYLNFYVYISRMFIKQEFKDELTLLLKQRICEVSHSYL